jgi:hypothetical protein
VGVVALWVAGNLWTWDESAAETAAPPFSAQMLVAWHIMRPESAPS